MRLRRAASRSTSSRPSDIARKAPPGVSVRHIRLRTMVARWRRMLSLTSRVGVEEAVDEDLVEIGGDELLCQLASLQVRTHQRRELVDLRAVNTLHGEHAAGDVVLDGLRYACPFRRKWTVVPIESGQQSERSDALVILR